MNLNYKNFIENLSKLNNDDKRNLAENIVNKIESIHLKKSEKNNWIDLYQTDVNLSMYEHGLIRRAGLKDYILTDYIKNNIYYVKDRGLSKTIINNSIFDIDISDIQNINLLESEKYKDWIMDFVELNVISYFDKEFANYIISKFIKFEDKNKFYKILSLYSAHYCLDMLVYLNKNTKDKEDKLEELVEISNYIFEIYEDFTIHKPKWVSQ